MSVETKRPVHGTEEEILEFLSGRAVPCPSCGYELRDIPTAKCPECGEPLVLKIGSPRARFGWLMLAMAPGCFSGVAAMFVMLPVLMSAGRNLPPGQGVPWPVVGADVFGFCSAASVLVMYRHRQRIMSWTQSGQRVFAASVWGLHVLAFAIFLGAMFLWA